MNKFLVFAGVIAVVAAIFVQAGDIIMTQCTDHECDTGCKVVGKVTQGQCSADHFRHDSSFKATCAAAPAALCAYVGIFTLDASNATGSCVDGNVQHVERVQCDVCMRGEVVKKWHKISGCNATGSLTLNMDCDMDCKTCKQTIKVIEKSCNPVPDMKIAFGYGIPAKCPQQILSTHYNASDDCTGDNFNMKSFGDSCYGNKRGSHYNHCNN